jgi:predicted phosphodiesterase
MGLEKIIQQTKGANVDRIMITSDYHIPFLDEDSYELMKYKAREYQPDKFIINGDFLDFYTISKYDQNPERKHTIQDERIEAQKRLMELRKTLPNSEIIYIEGNHETRLQKYLWQHKELYSLPELKLSNFLGLKDLNIKYIGADNDYWKQTSGHHIIGDMVISHGDNRTNGFSTSQYSGYSAKNSMYKLNKSVAMGHTHRLALIYHSTPYTDLVGIEGGCLCQDNETANWQKGFVTFEADKNKTYNHKIYKITNNKLYDNGYEYSLK